GNPTEPDPLKRRPGLPKDILGIVADYTSVEEYPPKLTLKGHEYAIGSVAFNHNDSQIISASLDKTIKVWDSNTGRLQYILSHDDRIFSAAFNHNGTQIVSTSEN